MTAARHRATKSCLEPGIMRDRPDGRNGSSVPIPALAVALAVLWPLALRHRMHADEPSPEGLALAAQVCREIQASRRRVSNATFDCVWKTFMIEREGPKGITLPATQHWEKQAFWWDNLGRRRNILQRRSLSADGDKLADDDPYVKDTLYNGEVVVHAKSYANRTRVGERPKSPEKATGYVPVIIGDAASPLRRGLESERNPLEYIWNIAMPEIKKAVDDKAITAASANDGTITLSILHEDGKSVYVKSVIEVAPPRNWAIDSVRSYRNDGGLARELVFDYKAQADGIWVPVRGRHRHWGDRDVNDVPYFDWGFEATKAVYNDPAFDQHVFDVKLPPDAAVSDTRYNVTYRIGSETAIAADLARYAADARKRTEDGQFDISANGARRTNTARWRKWILVANLVFVGVVVGWLTFRRVKRGAK